MRQPRRGELARYAAPAAFLTAVTIAVVLIHNGLQGGGSTTTPSVPTIPTTPATSSTKSVGTTTQTSTAGAQFYTVQSGDTLGGIAVKYGTTVELLQGLNPNVDPAGLQPGQRIRVK